MARFKYLQPDLPRARENNLIRHLFRNFISLHAVMHDLFFDGLSTDTSRKVLQRMVKQGLLTRYPLFHNRHYFRLGTAAAQRWAYPRTRCHQLGAQRLPYELGVLHYVSQHDRVKKRLLPHELKNRFEWFPDGLMQWAYLMQQGKLVTLRTELSGRADRIIEKFGRQLYDYSTLPQFRELIESDQFAFCVVTATAAQAVAIEQRSPDLIVDLSTHICPDLVHFM